MLLSIYLIWGWLTLSDIKKKARENNLDEEEVLKGLLDVGFTLECTTEKDEHGNVVSRKISPRATNLDNYLSRLVLRYSNYNCNEHGITNLNVCFLLDPFLRTTGNVANFMFCFGVGYLISSLIVIIRYMQNKAKISYRYIFWRPFAGALAADCFFLIIISGGSIIWNSVSDIKGLSLGFIAVFGAIYCERFELILENSINKSKKNNIINET